MVVRCIYFEDFLNRKKHKKILLISALKTTNQSKIISCIIILLHKMTAKNKVFSKEANNVRGALP